MENTMQRLKNFREAQALSQRDLANVSGVAQATISLIERGDRKVRPSTLRKLAEALGVEPSTLLPEQPEKAAATRPSSRLVDPPSDYFSASQRLEGYRLRCEVVRGSLQQARDLNIYTLYDIVAKRALFESTSILQEESKNANENSPATWRAVLSVLQDLLELHSAADEKLTTLKKTAEEVAMEDQIAGAMAEFREVVEGRLVEEEPESSQGRGECRHIEGDASSN